MKKIIIGMLLATVLSFSWDGVVTGTIGKMSIADGNNYDLRLNINGATDICNGNDWAYLNHSDDNYKTYLSVLLTAKATKQTVSVFTTGNSAGYCHIGYLVLD